MSRRTPLPMPRLALALAAAAVAALATAPTALADSTLSDGGFGELVFTADEGKANQVTISATKTTVTISDPAEPIEETVTPGCENNGANTVECFSFAYGEDFFRVRASLDTFIDAENDSLAASGSISISGSGGGGNDTLSASGFVPFEGNGGAGSDTLNGGSGADSLSGGEGADTVHGNGGNDAMSIEGAGDAVHGDGGNDFLLSAAGVFDGALGSGGPGVDTVFLITLEPEAPPPDYLVDLSADSIGSGGQSATVLGIENAITYQGSDTVLGSDSANRIDTVTNGDPLLSYLGEFGVLPTDAGDTVDPKGGPDFVTTGAGNDIVDLVDGVADRLDCGPGTDIVEADQLDELIDCENVDRSTVTPKGSPPSSPPPPPPAADTTAPICSLKGVGRNYRRKAFLRGGVRPTVSCNEPVTLEGQLTTPAKSNRGGKKAKRRTNRRRSRRASISRAGDLVLAEASGAPLLSRALRLKPIGRLRSQLGGRFKATLRIVARDLAGNATVLQRTVLVKPDRKKGKRRGKGRRGRR